MWSHAQPSAEPQPRGPSAGSTLHCHRCWALGSSLAPMCQARHVDLPNHRENPEGCNPRGRARMSASRSIPSCWVLLAVLFFLNRKFMSFMDYLVLPQCSWPQLLYGTFHARISFLSLAAVYLHSWCSFFYPRSPLRAISPQVALQLQAALIPNLPLLQAALAHTRKVNRALLSVSPIILVDIQSWTMLFIGCISISQTELKSDAFFISKSGTTSQRSAWKRGEIPNVQNLKQIYFKKW